MNEAMRKIMDDKIKEYAHDCSLSIVTSVMESYKDGYQAAYDLLISRMVFDIEATKQFAINQPVIDMPSYVQGAKDQFNQDLANLKGEE